MTTMTATGTRVPWVPTTDAFGVRLAMIRQLLHWNVKEAAIACGIPPGSWRQWEVFGSIPRDLVGTARAIADASGADMIWIMTGEASHDAIPMARIEGEVASPDDTAGLSAAEWAGTDEEVTLGGETSPSRLRSGRFDPRGSDVRRRDGRSHDGRRSHRGGGSR